jgi:hypothetical protein
MTKEPGKLAWVEERGEQNKKLFVVVLAPDVDGREKDIRSFGVESDGRYAPVREKAERFAERINSAHSAGVRAALEDAALLCERVRCRVWTPQECAFRIRALKEKFQ